MATEHWSDSIWITHLTDEPMLSQDLQALLYDVEHHRQMPSLVIDLSSVNSLRSSHLSQLILLQNCIIKGGGQIILSAPSDRIWGLFLASNLDQQFIFAENIPVALAGLQI